MIKISERRNYVLSKESLSMIDKNQLEEFERKYNFSMDEDGNINIPYTHKGFICNNRADEVRNSKIQAISFFSGAGGLDIGAQLAGVKVISSLDLYSDSVETLKLNKYFEHTVHFDKDISEVSASDFTEIIEKNKPEKLILIGGPPCQPFSKAGYWVTNEKRKGHEDPRNMIGQYFRLIEELNPDGFILENVESILHPSNRPAVESIQSSMEELGYNYIMLKMNAADYGIPQKRKRVFFLATKKKIEGEIEKTHGSEKDILKNPKLLPHERIIDWIAEFDKECYFDKSMETEGKYYEELRSVYPGKNYIALTEKAGHPNPKFVSGKRYWSFLLKLNPELPSWTIIASPGHWEGPFHWNNRRLSIKEAAAIQTFPEDYKFYGSIRSQRKQIGNAVPPLLGYKIVEYLCRWL